MNDGHHYDLEKLNPDKLRLKKRRSLLKKTIIFSIVIGLIGLKLLSLSVLTQLAISSYNKNNPSQSLQRLSPLGIANVIETYKFHFNKGDALFINGEYDKAEKSFRTAQKSVPKDFFCQLTLNLVLSMEAQADQFLSAKNYDKAIEKYDEIKIIVRDAKCGFSEAEQSADGKMQKVAENSKQKSDQAKQTRNGDNAQENKNTNQEENRQPSKDQQEKINNNTEQNIRKRQERQAQKNADNATKSDRKYDSKNW